MTTYPIYRQSPIDGLYEYQLAPGEMWHGVSANRAETEASAEREAARWRELATARANLLKYGNHARGCARTYWDTGACTCGWAELRAALDAGGDARARSDKEPESV